MTWKIIKLSLKSIFNNKMRMENNQIIPEINFQQ